jgi:chemotaxis protein histidine kinase CheA
MVTRGDVDKRRRMVKGLCYWYWVGDAVERNVALRIPKTIRGYLMSGVKKVGIIDRGKIREDVSEAFKRTERLREQQSEQQSKVGVEVPRKILQKHGELTEKECAGPELTSMSDLEGCDNDDGPLRNDGARGNHVPLRVEKRKRLGLVDRSESGTESRDQSSCIQQSREDIQQPNAHKEKAAFYHYFHGTTSDSASDPSCTIAPCATFTPAQKKPKTHSPHRESEISTLNIAHLVHIHPNNPLLTSTPPPPITTNLPPIELLKSLKSAISHAEQLKSDMGKIEQEEIELEEKRTVLKIRKMEVDEKARRNTRIIRDLARRLA